MDTRTFSLNSYVMPVSTSCLIIRSLSMLTRLESARSWFVPFLFPSLYNIVYTVTVICTVTVVYAVTVVCTVTVICSVTVICTASVVYAVTVVCDITVV